MKDSPVVVTILLIVLVVGAILCTMPLLHEARLLSARPEAQPQWEEAAQLQREAYRETATGDPSQARTMWEEVLVRWHEIGYLPGIAIALTSLGDLALEQGDLAPAEAYLQESLALLRELERPLSVANALHRLGRVAEARGDDTVAHTRYQEALALYRQLGAFSVPTFHRLGMLAARQQDWAAAQGFFEDALQHCEGPQDDALRAQCLTGLAQVADAQGHTSQAAELRREAQRLRPASGTVPSASTPTPPNQTPPSPDAVLLDEEAMAPAPRRDS